MRPPGFRMPSFSAFSMMGDFEKAGYPGNMRQPMLLIASGRDETVSTAAIEEFAGRHFARAQILRGYCAVTPRVASWMSRTRDWICEEAVLRPVGEVTVFMRGPFVGCARKRGVAEEG